MELPFDRSLVDILFAAQESGCEQMVMLIGARIACAISKMDFAAFRAVCPQKTKAPKRLIMQQNKWALSNLVRGLSPEEFLRAEEGAGGAPGFKGSVLASEKFVRAEEVAVGGEADLKIEEVVNDSRFRNLPSQEGQEDPYCLRNPVSRVIAMFLSATHF
jgi:hypothetical protein